MISKRGAKIRDSRRHRTEIREHISGMSSVQLTAFIKGFEEHDIGRIERAINKSKDDRKSGVIAAKQIEIERLQKQLEELEG